MNRSSNPAASLHLETFVCGPLETNAYLLLDKEARQAVVIDPSIESDAALQTARKWRDQGIQFTAIWNTHGHFDHVYDNARWKREFDIPIHLHPADAVFLEHLREQALWFGLPAPEIALPDAALTAGQTLEIGTHRATVVELPGHSPGSVGFDFGDFIVSGDVLFAASVGRTDLPGCSETQLAASLRTLFALAPHTVVWPGHGPRTTIGEEQRSNATARQILEIHQ